MMAFIFATLTVVAAWTSTKKARAPVLLNRQQTEEWKGWMQARPCHIPSAQGVRALSRRQEGPGPLCWPSGSRPRRGRAGWRARPSPIPALRLRPGKQG